MASDINAEVIIVGSGVAGALVAARLAAARVRVAVLEAGGKIDRTEATERYWNAVIKVPECPYPPSPEAMHPITNDLDFWYRQSGPDKFKSTYLKVVGGTTWHWLGTCLRLLPNDFKLNTMYGRGVDWPISYQDFESYYAEAEQEIGVAGDSNELLGSPRSNAYPMPAIPQTYLDKASRGRSPARRTKCGPHRKPEIPSRATIGLPAAAVPAASRYVLCRRNMMPRCTCSAPRQMARRCTNTPPQYLSSLL